MSTLLDPLRWGQAELHDLLTAVAIGPKPTARGPHHVVSAQHSLSAFTGQQALRAGGTAADACVTMVALDTVVLPGTSTLGGTLAALYHEVATGQTYALNAGLNAPLADAAPRDRSDRGPAARCWCRG
jgi:gamma-glutamyltranspeptidase